jgi:hypothetical protein
LRTLLALLAVLATSLAFGAQQAFQLALADGRLRAEGTTIRVAKGDQVTLRWTSDRLIALHLHGYDIAASVAPGGSATMRFTANIAGRFPISEHRHGGGHEKAVLYLVVLPSPLGCSASRRPRRRTASASASTCRCRFGCG